MASEEHSAYLSGWARPSNRELMPSQGAHPDVTYLCHTLVLMQICPGNPALSGPWLILPEPSLLWAKLSCFFQLFLNDLLSPCFLCQSLNTILSQAQSFCVNTNISVMVFVSYELYCVW